MKITTLETYMLSVPLPQPVRTSTSTISRVSELIVRLTTDAGLVGIGEAHGPFLSQAGREGMRGVGLGRQTSDLHFHRAVAVLEVHRRFAPEVVRALAVAVVEAGDVGGHARTECPAEELVHGPLRGLAHEVPERDVDGADGGHQLPALARHVGMPRTLV